MSVLTSVPSVKVIFQDASRLVIARVKRFPQRLLVNILTAYACSNIFTEQLFFAAGAHQLLKVCAGMRVRALCADARACARVSVSVSQEVSEHGFVYGSKR